MNRIPSKNIPYRMRCVGGALLQMLKYFEVKVNISETSSV